jgi:hypothetical protein
MHSNLATFYLDTTVQIERRCGPDATRQALKEMLTGGEHATSSQVRREWNSIMLGACTRLLNELPQASSADDLEARMNKGFQREPAHNWMITRLLVQRDPDLRAAEMRARQFLRTHSDAFFEEGVAVVRDGTECQVARRPATQNPITEEWSHNKMCKKTEGICSQHAFLMNNLDRAKAAATALEGSSRQNDRKMGKDANKILAKMPTIDSKGRSCWGSGGLGGDISIALECGEDEVLLTTDQSFDSICPAIGRKHELVVKARP